MHEMQVTFSKSKCEVWLTLGVFELPNASFTCPTSVHTS